MSTARIPKALFAAVAATAIGCVSPGEEPQGEAGSNATQGAGRYDCLVKMRETIPVKLVESTITPGNDDICHLFADVGDGEVTKTTILNAGFEDREADLSCKGSGADGVARALFTFASTFEQRFTLTPDGSEVVVERESLDTNELTLRLGAPRFGASTRAVLERTKIELSLKGSWYSVDENGQKIVGAEGSERAVFSAKAPKLYAEARFDRKSVAGPTVPLSVTLSCEKSL
jgi:hypothetical protein